MQTIFTLGQWSIRAEDGVGYEIVNLDPQSGAERFYKVVPGKYGEPLLVPEPVLAFDPPQGVSYVDGKGAAAQADMKISGVICRNADGEISKRFSLSRAEKDGISYQPTADGIVVDGEVFYLKVLFIKDKNRVKNYDAFYSTEKPANVQILELEDVL